MNWNEPPERDLVQEARDAKTKARDEQVRCPLCGEYDIKRRLMKAHQKRPSCVAAVNANKMKDAGLVEVREGGLAYKAGVVAQIGAVTALTDWKKASGGRNGGKSALTKAAWVPEWVAAVFDTGESWRLTEGVGFETAMPLYAKLMRQMADEPETRAAVESAYAIAGHAGVRGFVITPQMRAAELRKQASEAMARVEKFTREANELDPPEVSHA